MINKKTCKKCNIEKNINNFIKRKDSKDGYRNQCKLCEYMPPEKVKETNRKQYIQGKPKRKIYLDKNREHINKTRNKRRNERMKTDLVFRLEHLFKVKLRKLLKANGTKKKLKTLDILGCLIDEYKLHLESQWSLPHNLDKNGNVWMTWNNYGLYNGTYNYGWDIDHITPTSSAKTEEELIKLFHYTNQQPLCSKINRDIKKDKLNYNI